MWDVIFYDQETHTAYRVQTKRLTMRDGAAVDQLQDDLALRTEGRQLIMMRRYPLLAYGTAMVETVQLETEPTFNPDGVPQIAEDAPWQAFTLTEETYQDLSELLGLVWYSAVLQRNPHRDLSYELLKKSLKPATPARPSERPTSGSDSPEKTAARS